MDRLQAMQVYVQIVENPCEGRGTGVSRPPPYAGRSHRANRSRQDTLTSGDPDELMWVSRPFHNPRWRGPRRGASRCRR